MGITTEQLQARRNSMGASDMAAIIGVDPWRSAYDVWYSKRYELAELPAGDEIEFGNDQEEGLVRWAGRQIDADIELNVSVVHPLEPIFTANLDGAVLIPGSFAGSASIEAKATSFESEYGREGTDEVPERVIWQAQHQMFVGDHRTVFVPVLLARWNRPQRLLFRVERNEDLITELVLRGRHFWQEHVLRGVPPSGKLPQMDTIKRVPRASGSIAQVDPSIIEAFEEAKLATKTAQSEEEDAKKALMISMGDCEAADFGDAKQVYRYRQQSRVTVEEKRLRVAHPEIHGAFTTQHAYRVLRRVNR